MTNFLNGFESALARLIGESIYLIFINAVTANRVVGDSGDLCRFCRERKAGVFKAEVSV